MTRLNRGLAPLLSLSLAIFLSAVLPAQDTPAPTTAKPTPKSTPASPSASTNTTPYTLTELQHAHLHEAQLAYFIAARDLQKAGDDFNKTCAAAKTENHWPEGVQCSVQDLSIIPPAEKK